MSKADGNKKENTGKENKTSDKSAKNDKPKSTEISAADKKGDELDNLPKGELTFRAAVRFNKIIHVSAKSIVDVHRKVKELKISDFIDGKDDISVLGSGE